MKRNLANLDRCPSSYFFKQKNTYTSNCVCACVYVNTGMHCKPKQMKT